MNMPQEVPCSLVPMWILFFCMDEAHPFLAKVLSGVHQAAGVLVCAVACCLASASRLPAEHRGHACTGQAGLLHQLTSILRSFSSPHQCLDGHWVAGSMQVYPLHPLAGMLLPVERCAC